MVRDLLSTFRALFRSGQDMTLPDTPNLLFDCKMSFFQGYKI